MDRTQTITTRRDNWVLRHPLLRKYMPLVHEDLTATYSRDLHKWLIIAPIIGVTTGLFTGSKVQVAGSGIRPGTKVVVAQ